MLQARHEVLELPRVLLMIEADNAPGIAVARALGFRLTDDEPKEFPGKGRPLILQTWAHDLVSPPS
ncbi:hypothetical protein ACWEQL_09665 [Kitasatospora sp. NPDC004240]